MRPAILAFTLLAVPTVQGQSARPLPMLGKEETVSGPGTFLQTAPLRVEGHVRLENLTLRLSAPIVVASGAKLELISVRLIVSDQPGTANGSSNLQCEGPAEISISDSTMVPEGEAHPIWGIKGRLDVRNFQTENSEFHLDHTDAIIDNLNIFELEISRASRATAKHLRLVFLSTHSADDEQLLFENIPVDKPFQQKLKMGSGAQADLDDAQIQFFLLYVHGHSKAVLRHIGRAQLALFPNCQGKMTLPRGRMGSAAKPAVFPQPGQSNCSFEFTLEDVNVDTWDVYAGDRADLTFEHSYIDELTANGTAKLTLLDSEIYADWMAVAGNARVSVRGGTVGAQTLAKERPDLATSQVRASGASQTAFSGVRFDCGIVASERATVIIDRSLAGPRYVHRSGQAKVME